MHDAKIEAIYEKGIQLMTAGYTCAEATLRVLVEAMGWDSPHFHWAAAGYTGAIKSGKTICGTLFGGTIFLGYFHGAGSANHPELNDERRTRAITSVENLYNGFLEKFDATDCYALTGCNWGNRRDVLRYYKEEVFTHTCYRYFRHVLIHCLDRAKVYSE